MCLYSTFNSIAIADNLVGGVLVKLYTEGILDVVVQRTIDNTAEFFAVLFEYLGGVAVKKAEAEKMLVQARAEREANELKSASLTPAILKKMWIEKWDGKLPVYGNVPQIMMTK